MQSSGSWLLVLAAVALLILYVRLTTTRAKLSHSEVLRQSTESEIEKLRLTSETQIQNLRLTAEAQIESRARALLQAWQTTELTGIRDQQTEVARREALSKLEEWKRTTEKGIRQDAALRSQSVTAGKVAEQIVPYLPEFTYNPKDARFIGSPIDFVVFDGLNDGEVREVVIVEVKTKSSQLSSREKQIRQAVQAGRVVWKELRLELLNTGPQESVQPESATRNQPSSTRAEEPSPAPGVPVRVPPLGDSSLAVMSRWHVADGELLERDQTLCELETDALVFEIESPVDGRLVSRLVEDGAIVSEGDVLAFVRNIYNEEPRSAPARASSRQA